MSKRTVPILMANPALTANFCFKMPIANILTALSVSGCFYRVIGLIFISGLLDYS
jgi:hypothetical protein